MSNDEIMKMKANVLTPELVTELAALQQEAGQFLSTQQSYTKVIYDVFDGAELLTPESLAKVNNAVMIAYPAAAGFVFDSHRQGQAGGTGKLGNWAHLPTGLTKPFMLSGGLDADTVFDAIQTILPWGVDASSGIESAPGIKDGEKMRRFVAEVRRADCAELD